MNDYHERRRKKSLIGCLYSLTGIIVLGFLCLLFMLCGCKSTKYVPVETVKTEKVYIHDTTIVKNTTVRDDSTYTKTQMLLQKVDSAYLAMLGIINAPKEAWLLEKNTSTHHTSSEATTHQEKEVHSTDSVRTEFVQVPYPVPAQLTKWQQFCCDYGKLMVGATLTLVVIFIILLYWIRYKRNRNNE